MSWVSLRQLHLCTWHVCRTCVGRGCVVSSCSSLSLALLLGLSFMQLPLDVPPPCCVSRGGSRGGSRATMNETLPSTIYCYLLVLLCNSLMPTGAQVCLWLYTCPAVVLGVAGCLSRSVYCCARCFCLSPSLRSVSPSLRSVRLSPSLSLFSPCTGHRPFCPCPPS